MATVPVQGDGKMADIAAKEFALWIPPRDAIRQLAGRFGDLGNAALTLYGRLKEGILVAAAERAESHGVNSAFKVIPPEHWKALQHIQGESSLWQSGDILIDARSGYTKVSVGYHGIRFDPAQINKLVDIVPAGPAAIEINGNPAVQETTPVAEPAAIKEPTAAPKRRRVSPRHLKAWHAAYKAAYGGTPADTPVFALQSAQGMFPDKLVSGAEVKRLATAGNSRTPTRSTRASRRKPKSPRRR